MAVSREALPDWVRAFGAPLFSARIRTTVAEFLVEEQLPFEPGVDGSHDFLWVEKTGSNTVWVARSLARHAGVRFSDVGYSGLKDRHAVTRQWFSVPRRQGGVDWARYSADGVTVLRVRANPRKLRRGVHRANRFRIALRADAALPQQAALADRMRTIESRGIPNYFGEQRFGHACANVELARRFFSGARVTREERGFAISAARSLLFNEILAARVTGETWDRVLDGDIANLDGTNSVFPVEAIDAEMLHRCETMDIHPTATLWGLRSPLSRGSASNVERDATQQYADLRAGLEARNVEPASRALRLRVRDLGWAVVGTTLWLSFTLPRGSFATAVLREIAEVSDAAQDARSST